MPLDAILLTALRRELENSLLGAKIDRISMPEKDVLILSVHSREQGSRRVLISVRPGSARISLTEQKPAAAADVLYAAAQKSDWSAHHGAGTAPR